MNLKRWLSVILMMGLVLALSSPAAQAGPPFEPQPYYHHPHGNAYGWDGPRARGFDHHYKYFRHSYGGPHRFHHADRGCGGPPQVAYVAPVAPVIGVPYAQPQQPYFSQPAPRGLSGTVQYNF